MSHLTCHEIKVKNDFRMHFGYLRNKIIFCAQTRVVLIKNSTKSIN